MPHAKIDVAFIRDHFARVPEKDRPRAIALYLELVLTSAEMLLDGDVPEHVALICAHRIGVSRTRYGRSEVTKIVAQLEDAGLLKTPKSSTSRSAERRESSTSRSAPEHREVSKSQPSRTAAEPREVSKNQTLHLVCWADHHNSRGYVDDRRKLDADRKREKRGQTTIPGLGTNVRSGHEPDAAADVRADLARGGARTRSASETEKNSSSSGSRDEPPDDDELRLRLEHLGVNDRALIAAALNDRERATAWIAYGDSHATGNPAGYFRTNFTAGAWPPSSNGKPQTDPAERRERWLRDHGWRYTDDQLLDAQLADLGADDDERISLLELAADLRHAAAIST